MLTDFRFNSLLLISIIILSACSTDSKNTPSLDPDPSLQEQLQIVVNNAVDSGLPGVSLHVQDKDESISVVAGVINRETARPVTADSLFHAASIGKTFTATLLIRLVDMGHLELGDTIDSWLDPAMSLKIADSEMITVEMLLAHTSGIPDYFGNPEFVSAFFVESSGKSWTPTEILEFIENSENDFEPGTDYRYSNTNYVLLGVIAERITGMPIGAALRNWVFHPAGLVNTYGVFENLGQPTIARGYIPISYLEDSGLNIDLPLNGFDMDTSEWLHSEGLGDAPIHSTPSDLNSFIRTLIATETLVSGELKTQMLTESFPGFSEYGLGLGITENSGLTFEHSGKSWGLRSWMSYTPSQDSSFGTMVNGAFGDYDELFNDYLTNVYKVLERH